ncbi:MAG: hypothetical protein GX338_11830 [Firmicutes bacterium]|nr:hypothetical protein [Bacillota bacterium]
MSTNEFCEAVRAAVADELEAARMYMNLAQGAPHVAIRARIMCFAAEERRHARQLSCLCPEMEPEDGMDPDGWDWPSQTMGDDDLLESAWISQPPMPPGCPGEPQPPCPQPPFPPSDNFARGVAMAIEGEVHAIGEYAELAMMAPNPRARELILCIQKDEMYHKISFEFIQSVIMWNGYDEND